MYVFKCMYIYNGYTDTDLKKIPQTCICNKHMKTIDAAYLKPTPPTPGNCDHAY